MTITQTVKIPSNRRLIIDVPPEIPTESVILTFAPANEDKSNAMDDCLECAKHRDPKTGELRFNAVTLAAMNEARDIANGKLPGNWHHS